MPKQVFVGDAKARVLAATFLKGKHHLSPPNFTLRVDGFKTSSALPSRNVIN